MIRPLGAGLAHPPGDRMEYEAARDKARKKRSVPPPPTAPAPEPVVVWGDAPTQSLHDPDDPFWAHYLQKRRKARAATPAEEDDPS